MKLPTILTAVMSIALLTSTVPVDANAQKKIKIGVAFGFVVGTIILVKMCKKEAPKAAEPSPVNKEEKTTQNSPVVDPKLEKKASEPAQEDDQSRSKLKATR